MQVPAENYWQHHIQPLENHMDYQQNRHTQDVEDGLDEAQYYGGKNLQTFYQSEV